LSLRASNFRLQTQPPQPLLAIHHYPSSIWAVGIQYHVQVYHNSSTFLPPTRHPILYMSAPLLVTDPELYAHLVPAFVALLALGGQVGMPILILTCLRSKRLNRHSTFVNCCVASIIYSLAFCMLLSCFLVYSSPSDLTHLTPFQWGMGYIEYIRGNIAVQCLIMFSVLHKPLWLWLFSRCEFPPIFVARKQTDACVGCPLLSSCLCSRYDSQFRSKPVTKLIR
jgi:hypothetical protein